ncbi:AraC family transcriptional regulator [Rubellicoccus peritrichatus]|uniref:AraC family transcriptional regulator n=1 Tax=Rubellicoccus peritrichatus TaxID=3080537 RepID=A0AAQ3LJH7_9BACT|nr:AraC family transcriptional regulator [Puniceicoccus sp. CR14]WOO43354.1 AraC family transcriptional regulator [Puniceicoccus sp. CR14]
MELKKWEVDTNGDPFWRLYWNDTPGAFAHDGYQGFELVPSELMVIPPETPFTGRLENDVNHMHLTFLTRFVYKTKRIFTFPLSKEAKQRVRIFTEPSERPLTRIDQTFAANYLASLALSQIPRDGFSHLAIDTRVARTIEYMKGHLREIVSNDEFAAMANLNTNSYIRLFSESIGQSPQAYFAKLKIDHACVLLMSTEDTIEDITAAIGYCDRYHFSKMFKKVRNMSPVQYRKQSISAIDGSVLWKNIRMGR